MTLQTYRIKFTRLRVVANQEVVLEFTSENYD